MVSKTRGAFERLRLQQFPTEVADHPSAASADVEAARLINCAADADSADPRSDPAGGRRRPAGAWIIAAAVIMILVAAATITAIRGVPAQDGSAAASRPPTASDDQGLTTEQVLAVWETALQATPSPLIMVGASNAQIGQWKPPTDGNNKLALLSRHVSLGPDVAEAETAASNPTVTFADGTTQVVALLDAQQTAQLLITESGSPQPCDGCTPIVLTDPQPTTIPVVTAAGPATVPAWSFGVQGSEVRLVQASVSPADRLQTPRGLPYGLGNAETTVHVESDGGLTVQWIGAPSVAQAGGCGADYDFEFVESTNVVVLRFVQQPATAADTDLTCAAFAVTRTETVRPPHPLGSRILVHDRSGFVIPRD